MGLETLLTGKDVAKILQFSLRWIYKLMERGDIPIVRIGRAVRVRPEDLEDYIYEKGLDYSGTSQAFIKRRNGVDE